MGEYNIKQKGQSLIEIIVALSIGALLIIAATTAMVTVGKNNLKAKDNQVAGSLAQELIDNVEIISESDWNQIYNLSGDNYVTSSSGSLIIASGREVLPLNNKDFTRYFQTEKVYRSNCGTGDIYSGSPAGACVTGVENLEDPSTQKVTAFVEWNEGSIDIVQYLTRHYDRVFLQTDWSGGPLLDQVVTVPDNKFSTSTNIDFGTPGSITLSAGETAGDLTSSIFDTQRINGASFNAIIWQGSLGDGAVKFQIASSNSSSGPWNYYGWDGSANAYYPASGSASPDASIAIVPKDHNNKRYVRYKIYLTKTSASPQVNDIIINWSL